MEIRFKPVEQIDIADLLILIQEYYDYDGHPFAPEPIRLALENLIRHPDWGQAWFICRDNIPIGYVVLTLGYSLEYLGRDAFVDEIYIRASDRGQGIGKATFQFIEATCRDLGVTALHLEVTHHNHHAKAIYDKLGFVRHDRDLMTRWLVPHPS